MRTTVVLLADCTTFEETVALPKVAPPDFGIPTFDIPPLEAPRAQ